MTRLVNPLAIWLVALSALTFDASAQGVASAEIAPGGKLRVAVIWSNPVLVTKKSDGSIGGISADLAAFIAKSLGVTFEAIVYNDPADYTKSFGSGEWDIAIGPRESASAGGLGVSPDFMVVENLFVVAPGRSISSVADVDRPGVRLVVTKDGAPDRYLTPRYRAAEFIRISATTEAVRDLFLSGKADVYGSNAQAVFAVADAVPGSKFLSVAFPAVPMAVALQKGRSAPALVRLGSIVQEAKSAGVAQKSITAAGLRGVKPALN